MRRIQHNSISQFFHAAFKKIGVRASIYKDVTHGLVSTSLRGVDSHGIRLLPHYIHAARIGRINKTPRYAFRKTASATAVLDADHGYGIAAGLYATRKAISLARRHGVSVVTVKNSSHFGAAAIYSLAAAEAGMIGISSTHTDSLVVPYGGTVRMLGTNPLSLAAPCSGEGPFCLDMATTPISWNKLLMYRHEKRLLPEGVAVDARGTPTRDPRKAVALVPFGGYRGYGLALVVEMLCGLLTGMAIGPSVQAMFPLTKNRRRLGHFFMVIDVAKFIPLSVFKKRLKKFLDQIRDTKPARGFSSVMVSGDPEKKAYKERVRTGIPVSKELIEQYMKLARELHIAPFL